MASVNLLRSVLASQNLRQGQVLVQHVDRVGYVCLLISIRLRISIYHFSIFILRFSENDGISQALQKLCTILSVERGQRGPYAIKVRTEGAG